MKHILILFCSLIILSNCSKPENLSSAKPKLLVDSLIKNIQVLSSDDFEGRMPFTNGEKKTIDYLQKQFKAVGLEPGNGDSYLQSVPMVNILAKAEDKMTVESKKGKFTLNAYDDYIIWTDKTDENISLDKNELIFAGYGVVAPEHNWNDYEGLDVKGKVVLVMVNDPGFWVGDSTLFKGNEMTYYGRWTYKFEEAARQGAKGCLIIHNTKAASYPFRVQQNSFNTSRLNLDKRGSSIPNADVIGWIPEHIANRLFNVAGYDSTLLVKANQRGFKAVPLGLKLSTKMKVESTYNKSYNVVGKVTGSKYPDEVIIYSAHWDHLGIGTPDETGDTIHNGALDNATGTAALIELARAFKDIKPERTIILLAVTAEEQGLLGSQYYAENPIYPVNKTLANINIDGLNQFEPTNDMIIIGEGQSDLEETLKSVVEKVGRYIAFDEHKEAGYYYRSDHFNFAKMGVPALYTETGIDVVGKGKEFGKQLQKDYTDNHYHRPSDEFDSTTWTMHGGMQDLEALFEVGYTISKNPTWPKWHDGSEFKAIREASK
jgi:Zn-dependent M28 family amino/carboxypeptidase